ncbi:hypothetical protein EVS84_10255 [Pseudomonas koreensis]|uniref:Uncharacterized protein n=1 Tax=Pseudomonas koreensis TaxID=198620 RepID=A0A4V1WHY8_9PSED|nr:hypothetical protein EVS84_10255 [Pseudomonas koreensis]
MWERACSRMRCVSHRMWRLIHSFREQARSHTGCALLTGLRSTAGPAYRQRNPHSGATSPSVA